MTLKKCGLLKIFIKKKRTAINILYDTIPLESQSQKKCYGKKFKICESDFRFDLISFFY